MTDNRTKLSTHQCKLYDKLRDAKGNDVSLSKLYAEMYGDDAQTELFHDVSNRAKQQKLGPLVARINHKLKDEVIEPGLLKQTYRLSPLKSKVS